MLASYKVVELCECGNEARYWTSSGHRRCSLCASGDVSVRDCDIPRMLTVVGKLVDATDVSDVGILLQELKSMIGGRT